MDRIIGFKQAVVWDKCGLGMGIHYRRNYEFMLIAQKKGAAGKWYGGNNTPNVFRLPKIIPSEEQHPTVKPVDLMKHFIKIHSEESDLILDPFSGSGTTAVACHELNRRWIMIEKELRYVGLSRRRIAQVTAQTKLWWGGLNVKTKLEIIESIRVKLQALEEYITARQAEEKEGE